jgi:hypothetical protein
LNKMYESLEKAISDVMVPPQIADSGERRQFDTGAVRDISQGKGRCDLMPLDVVAMVTMDEIFSDIYDFTVTKNISYLMSALLNFCKNNTKYQNTYDMFLELAKHFENGALKYGERNWEKGINLHCYIDSAVRHYLKYRRGDTDEPHDRAFVWNIVCCIWTSSHRPTLDDIPDIV